jgi:hypothetical protein
VAIGIERHRRIEPGFRDQPIGVAAASANDAHDHGTDGRGHFEERHDATLADPARRKRSGGISRQWIRRHRSRWFSAKNPNLPDERSPMAHARSFLTFLTGLSILLGAPRANAAPDSNPARFAGDSHAFHADVEVDPTAYVLDGYSLHAGLGSGSFRVDLGAYALALPEFVHGNRDFEASFNGYGAKFQYFPFVEQTGGFVGMDFGVIRSLVRLKSTKLADRQTSFGVGVNAGWRFDLVGGLYATPWLGVSRAFGIEKVELGGKTFESSPWVVFPAVHLGLRLR